MQQLQQSRSLLSGTCCSTPVPASTAGRMCSQLQSLLGTCQQLMAVLLVSLTLVLCQCQMMSLTAVQVVAQLSALTTLPQQCWSSSGVVGRPR